MMDRPRWEREGADWPNRAASRFVRAAGLEWHVQVMGAGPALLLLHGTGAATHSWRDLMPLLAERYTVVAPDLPGHGFTRGVLRDGSTLPALSRAVAELLVALDVTPAAVIGHSAGAAIALRMMLDERVGRVPVVALSPALLPFPGLAAQLFPTMAKLLFVNPFVPYMAARFVRSAGDVTGFLERATGSTIDATGSALYARLFAHAGHVHGALSMMASWDLDTLARALPRVAVPVLIVHGARDAAIPVAKARESALLIPGCQWQEHAALGHLAHEEAPARIAGDLMAFVEAGARTRDVPGGTSGVARD